MNVFGEIRNLVIASLEKMQVSGDLPDGLSFDLVTVEPPKNPDHGDMATNAAMVLSSPSMYKYTNTPTPYIPHRHTSSFLYICI